MPTGMYTHMYTHMRTRARTHTHTQTHKSSFRTNEIRHMWFKMVLTEEMGSYYLMFC